MKEFHLLMGVNIESVILIFMRTVSTKHNDDISQLTRKWEDSSLVRTQTNAICY